MVFLHENSSLEGIKKFFFLLKVSVIFKIIFLTLISDVFSK